MNTRSSDRSSRLEFPLLAITLALALPACKKDEEKAKESEPTKSADASDKTESKANEGKTPDTKDDGGGLGETVADAVEADSMSAAGALVRGSVLAHVMLPNPAALLGKVKKQAAPEEAGMFLEPEFIKSMGAMQLGSRGEVLKNVEFDKPVACVLVDSTATEFPVACTIGYTGGADALVKQLGEDGKQADAKGTKGHYLVADQHLFVDALGDRVVVGTDPDAITKAKPYLEKNVIGRAEENLSDIEVVGYVAAAMTRYEKELAPLLEQMGKPTLPADGDNPIQRALADSMMGSNKHTVDRFKQMEQVTVGLGFDEAGFTTRWAVFPTKDSELDKEWQAVAGGPVDLAFVEKMPADPIMLGAVRFDGKIGEMASFKAVREAMITEYAKEVGKDAATVTKAIDDFFAEETTLYGDDFVAAFAFEPSTLGGLVFEVPLEEGKSGRESWKTWSSAFTVEGVLGADAAKKVAWTFKADAATIGGTPVDRWTLELTKEALAEIEKDDKAKLDAVKAKWPSLQITIDRAEVGGRAIFVMTPSDGDKYMQAAIDAANGTGSLGGNAGFKTVAAKNAKVSAMYALDVKRGADYLRFMMPPEEAAKIPAGLGNDMSDVYFSNSYGRAGAWTGQFSVSQPLIDQIRVLAAK